MATSNNILLSKASGKLGNIILRQYKGKTVMSACPGKRRSTPHEAQITVMSNFKQAVIYAKWAMNNPERAEAYRMACGPGQSVYTKAVADCMNAPAVTNISALSYTGLPGQQIVIFATDDFRVNSILVIICDGNGVEIERGPAALDSDNLSRIYQTTASNTALKGTIIKAVATDLPGNEGELEIVLQ